MNRSLTTLALATLAVLAPVLAGSAPAERLTDKQVKTLLEDIKEELVVFEAAIDPAVRKSILRSQIGETDVQAFFKDLRQNRDKAQKRLGTGYSASTEIGAFLNQATAFEVRTDEGWSLYGAEGAWKSLRPLLVRLADAYGIEWGTDPSSWRSRRKSDGEIQEVIDSLAGNVTSFRKAVQSDLKSDRSLAKKDRKALVDRAYDLEAKAAGLSEDFRKTKSVATGMSRLEASMAQFEEAVGDRASSSEAELDWDKIQVDLAWLREEFDLPEIR